MLKNKTILIPFTLPWDWSADYQKQTCLELAKNNQVIAYFPFEGQHFLKRKLTLNVENKNISINIPTHYLPLNRFKFVQQLNRKISLEIIKKQLPTNTILWIFDPIFHYYPSLFKSKALMSIYDCVDYHDSADKKIHFMIREQEKKLLMNSDYVFTNSKTLQNIHRRHQPHLVPQGFDLKIFSQNNKKIKIKINTTKPIIGFVGGINSRLDFKLLTVLITNNQQWNFFFIGPIQFDSPSEKIQLQKNIRQLKKQPNVIWHTGVSRKNIPAIIDKFDVAMIPYDINYKFNQYCYPMKLFEYFYLKKPVISTPIEELQLKKFNHLVKISNSAKGWETHLQKLLSKPWPKNLQRQQKVLSLENSWQNKIAMIDNILSTKKI